MDIASIDGELASYEKQLRQYYAVKLKLVEEIDSLDPDDRHYIKRKADLDDRLYRMYDKIENVETQLIETRAKKQAVEAEKLTGDNIYKVLIYFEKLYAVMNETVVLLVRECAHDDEMISIKVDLEGIQLNQGEYKLEEKPTYGNVKKWIKAKYGFNVTNLYIGQIKDKIGLEKRKNYNIGSGEGRIPNCLPEKEEAIMEAFKYFGLI